MCDFDANTVLGDELELKKGGGGIISFKKVYLSLCGRKIHNSKVIFITLIKISRLNLLKGY